MYKIVYNVLKNSTGRVDLNVWCLCYYKQKTFNTFASICYYKYFLFFFFNYFCYNFSLLLSNEKYNRPSQFHCIRRESLAPIIKYRKQLYLLNENKLHVYIKYIFKINLYFKIISTFAINYTCTMYLYILFLVQ